MKKIIDGKTYNTETAECLGEWSSDYPCNDFNYCEESLYRTKKGQYFLSGSGGPLSRYSRSCGNTSTGGSDLNLVSETEAKEWAENHLTAKEYLEVFEAEEG